MIFILVVSLFLLTSKMTQGLRCLHCADVIDPRHCHTITFCNDFEECFVDKFGIESGEFLYNVGCRANKICQQQSSTLQNSLHEVKSDRQPRILCSKCCNDGDLCNVKGCGASGYPLNYGPTCLHCLQIKNPATCDVIQNCNSDEHCFIEELTEFGDIYYKTKCLPSHECSLTGISESLIGKREVHRIYGRSVTCSACCDSSLCNNQCPIDKLTTKKLSLLKSTTTTSTTTTTSATTSTSPQTTTEKVQEMEYLVMFLKNNLNEDISNDIFISSQNEFKVYIELAYYNQTKTLKSSQGIVHLNYTRDITADENVIENKGILIKTYSEIYVDVISIWNGCCTGDAYGAITVKSLGTEYVVVSLKKYYMSFKNEMGVVAIYDNTSIIINLKISSPVTVNGRVYNNGDKLHLNLVRLQAFQLSYVQTNERLTNMKVTGNKPFAMFSGNQCENINKDGCSLMVESIPPISSIGDTYIVPHVQNAFSEPAYMKITLVNDTSVAQISVIERTGQIKNFSSRGSFLDTINSEHVLIVHGNEKFLLTLYVPIKVSNHYVMMNVPSTCHYSNQYVITTPPTLDFHNYISVVIEDKYRQGLLLDGIPVKTNNSKSISFSGKTWMSISIGLSNGRHNLVHQDKNVTFGVIQYGYRDMYSDLEDTKYNYHYGFAVINDLTSKSNYCA